MKNRYSYHPSLRRKQNNTLGIVMCVFLGIILYLCSQFGDSWYQIFLQMVKP